MTINTSSFTAGMAKYLQKTEKIITNKENDLESIYGGDQKTPESVFYEDLKKKAMEDDNKLSFNELSNMEILLQKTPPEIKSGKIPSSEYTAIKEGYYEGILNDIEDGKIDLNKEYDTKESLDATLVNKAGNSVGNPEMLIMYKQVEQTIKKKEQDISNSKNLTADQKQNKLDNYYKVTLESLNMNDLNAIIPETIQFNDWEKEVVGEVTTS